VAASRQERRLVITVEDNGVGLRPEANAKNGIGLSNLRARLETLYGTNQEMKITSGAAAGVVVRIETPWQEAPLEENTSAG